MRYTEPRPRSNTPKWTQRNPLNCRKIFHHSLLLCYSPNDPPQCIILNEGYCFGEPVPNHRVPTFRSGLSRKLTPTIFRANFCKGCEWPNSLVRANQSRQQTKPDATNITDMLTRSPTGKSVQQPSGQYFERVKLRIGRGVRERGLRVGHKNRYLQLHQSGI